LPLAAAERSTTGATSHGRILGGNGGAEVHGCVGVGSFFVGASVSREENQQGKRSGTPDDASTAAAETVDIDSGLEK
jgi:hypothetical protein